MLWLYFLRTIFHIPYLFRTISIIFRELLNIKKHIYKNLDGLKHFIIQQLNKYIIRTYN